MLFGATFELHSGQSHQVTLIGVPKTVSLANRAFIPAKRGGFYETEKMMNFRSNQYNKGFGPRENDENDENHAAKGMVYQRHGFLFPDIKSRPSNGRGRFEGQTAGGHPKASPRPRQPLFAARALGELESACR